MSSNSTNKATSSRSKHSARVIAQTPIDAKLHVDFEESDKLFDYSNSVDLNVSSSTSNVPSSTISAYLQKIQRGRFIQPIGCLLAVDEQSFKILAFSENAPEMLDLAPHAVPNIEQQEALTFGTDVRTLFRASGAAALHKAANFGEINLLNPILLHCKNSGKPFYAILHRIDVGLVIDLEPVNPADVPGTAAGSLKSYKLAAKAISKLQSLPSGSISLLCDVLVKEISELTGYDRVMVYKFHEDEHGEVVAEFHEPGLEPYLGLHYPATDIPQASRFLFMKNKVRMICDARSSSVRVVQDRTLRQPLSLCGSSLRAPHGCHAQYMVNMGSIASLVMSVMINDNEDESSISGDKNGRKLWGLVVCHHTSPRFVPFPLRYACEFLIQVFGVQINKEVELAAQMREKQILQTQTVLCDMLMRDAPVGIITQSPNIMDLVKCDGAALYYNRNCWCIGITPTESQIIDVANWLDNHHSGTTGLSTDSLMEAGYPLASVLGDAVCGMAAIKISSKDFLFWFRSNTSKEIKWGGAKHDPDDKDDEDGRKMHPRSSFKAFLEVVKGRSLPWEDVEMDSIHSLQLILRGSLPDDSRVVVNVPKTENRAVEEWTQKADELRKVANEMVRLIETAAVPILAVDRNGCVNGWNVKVAEVTGLDVQQAMGMALVELVADDSVDVVNNMLVLAFQGTEEQNIEIKLKNFGPHQPSCPIILVVNSCCTRDIKENIVGVCFVGQDVTVLKQITDKYTRIQGDYVGIVRNPSVLIPPIFITDEQGRCSEWNVAMQKLTGLKREEAIDRILLGEVFTVGKNFGCRLRDPDTLTKLKIMLNGVIMNNKEVNTDKILFGFYDKDGKYVEALVNASKRCGAEGRVTGALGFLHVPSPELQYAMQLQQMSEQAAIGSLKKVAYVRQEIRKPLDGITCIQRLMEVSELSSEQSRLLRISSLCREQLMKVVNDSEIETIEESYMELSTSDFRLEETLEAVRNQAMFISREREVDVVLNFPSEISNLQVHGDRLRLQQALSDFLTNALLFTPAKEGSSVTLTATSRTETIGKNMHIVHLEFRITHPAPGVPEGLIHEMFNHNRGVSREGLGLYVSQKLVKIMNGTVQYLRGEETSSFIILVEFPSSSHL